MYTDRVVYCLPFNSRPLKEVDFVIHIHIISLELSIHDLSRRSTNQTSVTYTPYSFQFTTSQGGRPDLSSSVTPNSPFNSRPLKEVDDQGGSGGVHSKAFNSRPLKEVDFTCIIYPPDI